jgi:hypothetical protein
MRIHLEANLSGRPVCCADYRETVAMHASMYLATIVAGLLFAGYKYVKAYDPYCTQVRSNEVRVAKNQTCKFSYDGRDMAKYVVTVTGQPMHGQATGEGKYLRYVAKPGFVGEDRVTIRIERRLAHVQWETQTVKVKVGPT